MALVKSEADLQPHLLDLARLSGWRAGGGRAAQFPRTCTFFFFKVKKGAVFPWWRHSRKMARCEAHKKKTILYTSVEFLQVLGKRAVHRRSTGGCCGSRRVHTQTVKSSHPKGSMSYYYIYLCVMPFDFLQHKGIRRPSIATPSSSEATTWDWHLSPFVACARPIFFQISLQFLVCIILRYIMVIMLGFISHTIYTVIDT